MDKKQALDNLLVIREVFGHRRWWLDCGTLLGAIRDKDFIDHDLDTDVGILEEDFDDTLVAQLQEKGFRILHIFGTRDYGYEVSLARGGVKTDIFLYYKEKKSRWFACWKNGFRNGKSDVIKMVYKDLVIEKRQFIEFLGFEFPALFYVEEYLTARYGDWQVVDKDFRWDKDPHNIENV